MTNISPAAPMQRRESSHGRSAAPLVVITILFFMWGLITALNDVLIPHLKALYSLTYVQAMLVQFCFFGAYFVVSIPAGALVKRIGYQRGAVVGLLVAAGGCALFIPASMSGYALFLLAFFVLAAGITILQVAANPYVAALGDARTASSRLTLTQAFNSLGTTIAPALGGLLILSGAAVGARDLAREAALVQGPYLALSATLVVLAVVFARARLPRIIHAEDSIGASGAMSVLGHSHLLFGAIGIFLYVGGEVSIGSFLISYLGDPAIGNLAAADAAPYVSLYWGGAMAGRFVGSAAMRFIKPGYALAMNAGCSMLLILVGTMAYGRLAMYAMILVGLCNSIMFQTIFSMSLNRLGKFTGQASGLLCMAIVGGAIIPFLQGEVADAVGLQLSFLIPAACYSYILFFGLKYADMYEDLAS